MATAAYDTAGSDRDVRVRAELVTLMYRLSRGTRYLPFIALLLLIAVYWNYVPHWQLIALFAAYTASKAAADWLRRAFDRADPPPIEAPVWARRFAGVAALSGTVWGIAAWRLIDAGQPLRELFVSMVLVLTVTSSVISRSAYLPAFYAFSGTTGIFYIAAELLQGTFQSTCVAIGAFVYVACLAVWAHSLNRSQQQTIALRFENTELIDRLSAARETAETARVAAEAGNRAKSEFLATISHELRTPLNGIIGMTGLLLGTRLDAEQRSYAEVVRESGEALLGIINDILDLSKLEMDRVEVEAIAFDLTPLVEGAVELLVPRAHAKALDVETYIAPDVPARMIGDPARLRQILLNLLGNAFKFTEAGWVLCEVHCEAGDKLRFEVSDSGVGIDPAVAPRLFERFTQGDASISRKYGGTGLGLAISKRLVEAMGGDIGVDSRPGEGSRFWFRLPLQAAPTAADDASAAAVSDLRVLLVAPATMARERLMHKLRDWGLQTEAAGDAAQALAALAAATHAGERFDIALLDDRLGDAQLAETIAQIRDESGTALPIVLTVNTGAERRAVIVEADAAVVRVSRPVRRKQLCRALAEAANPNPGRGSPVSVSRSSAHALRVLVADDVPVNRRLTARLLKLAGHQVDTVGDGHEAVEAVRSSRYDLVLMDMDMPRLHGLAAAAQIRALPGGAARVPIIALTAHSETLYLSRWREAGMNDYLTKPIDAERLHAIVEGLAAPARDEA